MCYRLEMEKKGGALHCGFGEDASVSRPVALALRLLGWRVGGGGGGGVVGGGGVGEREAEIVFGVLGKQGVSRNPLLAWGGGNCFELN